MLRASLHTFVAAFVIATVLTGCKPAEPAPAPGPEAPPAPLPNPGPAPVNDNGWQAVVTGTGYALVHRAGAEDQLRLACISDPGRLRVWVGPFNPIGSEERLSVGFDDKVVALVAASTKPGPGVDAEGQVPMTELAALPTATTVAASYGAQSISLPAPGKVLGDAFVEACRQAVEE